MTSDKKTILIGLFKSRTLFICLAFTLLAFFIRTIGLSLDSLWYDEAYSVRMVRMSVSEIIRFTITDVHPPLYFLFLHFWTKLFGESETAVRMLSVLFSALTVFVFYQLALKLFNSRVAFFAALLLTLSPLHVFFAQETRMYSQLTFFTVASIYFYICLLKDNKRVSLVLYVAFTILLLYTHIYATFVLMAQFFYFVSLFVVKQHPPATAGGTDISLRRWLTTQIAIGLLFLPWAFVIFRQVTRAKRGFWIPQPDWLAPFQTLIEYSGSLWLALLFLPLFVYGIKRCREESETSNFRVLLLLWLILPIAIPFIISKLSSPFYLTKYTISASLPFYLFAAFGLNQLKKFSLQMVLVSLLLICSVAELHALLTTLKRERWNHAAYNVEQAAQPGDLVLFNSMGSEMAFAYYMKRKDITTAVFPYSAEDETPPTDFVQMQRALREGFGSIHDPQTEQQTKEKLQKIVGNRKRIWIVTRYGEAFKNDFMKAFENEFRVTTEPPLCTIQRKFLFREIYNETDSTIFLQRSNWTCAAQIFLLER